MTSLTWLAGLPRKAAGWLLAIIGVAMVALLYGQRKRVEGEAVERERQDAEAARQIRDMLHAPRVRDRDVLRNRLRSGEF